MKFISRAALLGGATLFGMLAAQWTRTDQLPATIHWLWIYGLLAHILVLSLWTVAWMFFWRDGLRRRGGRLFGWAIPLAAAAAAELVQKYLPGHFPDWMGFFYNLAGVSLGLLLAAGRGQAREPRASNVQNSAAIQPVKQP